MNLIIHSRHGYDLTLLRCPFDLPEHLTSDDEKWIARHLELAGVEPYRSGTLFAGVYTPNELRARRRPDSASS